LLLSGDDPMALASAANGAHGCISVTSNIAPKLCSEFQEACMSGDFKTALSYQDRLLAVHDVMFVEPNPGPAKYAASLMGLCGADVRLPLIAISEGTRNSVEAAISKLGLLEMA